MLLHIGDNVAIPLERVLFIINARRMMPDTEQYIRRMERTDHMVSACRGRPKSYIVTRERTRDTVYASLIAPATLEKRWRDEISRSYLRDTAVVSVDIRGL